MSDSVCADEQGNVWLANRGSGVVRITDGKVFALNVQAGTRKFRAYSICPDDQGSVWGIEGSLFRFPRDHPGSSAIR